MFTSIPLPRLNNESSDSRVFAQLMWFLRFGWQIAGDSFKSISESSVAKFGERRVGIGDGLEGTELEERMV